MHKQYKHLFALLIGLLATVLHCQHVTDSKNLHPWHQTVFGIDAPAVVKDNGTYLIVASSNSVSQNTGLQSVPAQRLSSFRNALQASCDSFVISYVFFSILKQHLSFRTKKELVTDIGPHHYCRISCISVATRENKYIGECTSAHIACLKIITKSDVHRPEQYSPTNPNQQLVKRQFISRILPMIESTTNDQDQVVNNEPPNNGDGQGQEGQMQGGNQTGDNNNQQPQETPGDNNTPVGGEQQGQDQRQDGGDNNDQPKQENPGEPGGGDNNNQPTKEKSPGGGGGGQQGQYQNQKKGRNSDQSLATVNTASFCDQIGMGSYLGNGTQQRTTTCSVTIQGVVPSFDRMVSSVIISPRPGDVLQRDQALTVRVRTNNMELGLFDDPQTKYYMSPQTVNAEGIVQGHQHVTVQQMGNGQTPPDPRTDKLTFFKGLDQNAIQNSILETVIPPGSFKEPGLYRICTITGTRSHQPVIMPVARRGSQDDCIRVNVT